MSKKWIAPSILAADFAHLEKEVELLNHSEADYIHIDIMDGVFVPNISFGFPVCSAVHRHAKKPMDFHLMIKDADPYLEDCMKSGAEIISVHYEACNHLHRTVSRIKELGAKAGVVLNPHTSVDALEEILPHVDLVLLMSVNPGSGGQSFIETTFSKVRKLKAVVDTINPDIIIEVDGGVNDQNARGLFEAGADMLVAGSFVFKADDPAGTISKLKSVQPLEGIFPANRPFFYINGIQSGWDRYQSLYFGIASVYNLKVEDPVQLSVTCSDNLEEWYNTKYNAITDWETYAKR